MKVIFKTEDSKYTAEYKNAITWPEAIELMRSCLISAYPYLTNQQIIDYLEENNWGAVLESADPSESEGE